MRGSRRRVAVKQKTAGFPVGDLDMFTSPLEALNSSRTFHLWMWIDGR